MVEKKLMSLKDSLVIKEKGCFFCIGLKGFWLLSPAQVVLFYIL